MNFLVCNNLKFTSERSRSYRASQTFYSVSPVVNILAKQDMFVETTNVRAHQFAPCRESSGKRLTNSD